MFWKPPQLSGESLPPVDLATGIDKLLCFFLHANGQRSGFVDFFLRGVLAYVLSDLHRTEVRATHRTEVRQLGAFLRQGLVVIFTRDFGIQREVKLVFPTKLETRLR